MGYIISNCGLFSNHQISKRHCVFFFYKFYVLFQFSFALGFTCCLMFWVWIPICCRWVFVLFRYDVLVRVFLYYFVWCMDNNRCKCQYGSEWQVISLEPIFDWQIENYFIHHKQLNTTHLVKITIVTLKGNHLRLHLLVETPFKPLKDDQDLNNMCTKL